MKFKIYALIFLLASGMLSINAQPSELSADNGVIKVKLDLTRGGAINYLSISGARRNIVNINDEGRYIQQSYYAGNNLDRQSEGQASSWSPWPWNPIQVGDAFGNRAEILDYKQNDDTLYVKCIPMLWDMNNEPAEAVMEQWTILKDNVLEVRNRLTCSRTDSIYGENLLRDQELPAVYPISALENLYCYIGDDPFTNDILKNLPVVNLSSGFWGRYYDVSEHWMAFVDNDMYGLGIYNPQCTYFLAGMSGSPGYEAMDASTSYIAPIKKEALNKNSVYEYTYLVIVGTVEEIRAKVYIYEGFEAPIQKTEWEFNEDDNFESWQLNGALEGEVSNGYLQMNVIAEDPFMTNADGMAINASKFDKILIKMKNNTLDTVAVLSFINAAAPQQYNMIPFPITPTDSIYREYEVTFSESQEWKGIITSLRLEPVSNVSSGSVSIDYIRIYSSFANDSREKSHSINIIPFIDGDVERYYISWASSSGSDDGWQHDIYNQTIAFTDAENIDYITQPKRFIGSGNDEAQEPVQVAINPIDNLMLSVWEDGSGSTVDVRGQLHYTDGTIVKNNWIIDGEVESQHSPDVVHINKYFLVSLTDEAPPAQVSMNVLLILDDKTGEQVNQFQLSPSDKDQWWTVASSDNNRFAFVGWGNGENFYGSVIKSTEETITKTDQRFYISSIDQYYYSVAWLENISKFIAIAKVNSNSVACLIDTNGIRSSFTAIQNSAITRETELAVRWDEYKEVYQILFTSNDKDVTLLSVTDASINLTQLNENIISATSWPTTGIACKFVNSTIGSDLWNSDRKVLIAHNNGNSNDAIYHFLKIEDLTDVENSQSENVLNRFELLQAYPNPFNPSTVIEYQIPEAGEVELTVFNVLGEKIRTLLKKYQSAGSYEVVFNAEDISSGIYLYKLTAGSYTQIRKMIFMK